VKVQVKNNRLRDVPRLKSDSGATVLEFAIVLPILMLACLSVIDLARYLTIQALLNKGAEDGLNMAMKMPNLDIDIRNLKDTDANYQVFREARRRVIWAATRLPLATLVTDFDTPSSAQLAQWTITDQGMDGVTPSYNKGAVLLRPGEQAAVDIHGTTVVVDHPTVKPGGGGAPPPQTPEMLMKKNPISIQLDARVDMFLPFFGTMMARGVATGYRENIPTGPLPQAEPGDAEAVDGLAFAATTSTVITTSSVATTSVADEAAAFNAWTNAISITCGPNCGIGPGFAKAKCPVEQPGNMYVILFCADLNSK
jgi:hypothetical protein